MTGNELRVILESFGISQVTLSKLLGVTARAVNMWVREEREIPGPADAYLRLFQMLPAHSRALELERAKGKDISMREGMYEIKFHTSGNPQSWGIGVLNFGGGIIWGMDTGRAKYDGTYEPSSTQGITNVRIKVTFPPNGMSIFGLAHPYEWSIDVTTTLDSRQESGNLDVATNIGRNVAASYQYLRSIPEAA